MTERNHLSIGEVLSLLQDDFSDITISKIRFLESQGLIDPERTPSGYRKFTEADVARLRWILRQQRENFLPLKVIKDRLDEGVPELEPPAAGGVDESADEPQAVDAAVEVAGEAVAAAGSTGVGGPTGADDPSAPPAPVPPAAPGGDVGSAPARPRPLFPGGPAIALSLDELCRDTGLTARNVNELERYGLLAPDTSGASPVYRDDAVVVARAAAALRAQGVEARHLRMYKVAAEREAGYYEQLLMPMLKRRSAKSRREAVETLDDLLASGDEIRHALLRQAFGDLFDGR